MSVTLAKTPRDFSVFVLNGSIHRIAPTPTTDEGHNAQCIEAAVLCIDVVEVKAIDRHDAYTQALTLVPVIH
ncbi:hypothetical protein [Streptomyces sp. bgisy060]|uniref:hypothetical protein n=1 Tax=Streptomyces sp. bgisy060 TaxID=3413775 RepID=UPI003EBD2168